VCALRPTPRPRRSTVSITSSPDEGCARSKRTLDHQHPALARQGPTLIALSIPLTLRNADPLAGPVTNRVSPGVAPGSVPQRRRRVSRPLIARRECLSRGMGHSPATTPSSSAQRSCGNGHPFAPRAQTRTFPATSRSEWVVAGARRRASSRSPASASETRRSYTKGRSAALVAGARRRLGAEPTATAIEGLAPRREAALGRLVAPATWNRPTRRRSARSCAIAARRMGLLDEARRRAWLRLAASRRPTATRALARKGGARAGIMMGAARDVRAAATRRSGGCLYETRRGAPG
jgi:hypothetical protein